MQPTAIRDRTRLPTCAGVPARAWRHVANTRGGGNEGHSWGARRTLTRVGVFPYMPHVSIRGRPPPGQMAALGFFKNTRTSLEVST